MAVRVYIDNVALDVPVIGGIYPLTGSITRRLNRPAQARINVPMQYSLGGAGSRLKIEIDDFPFDPAFHGFIMDCSTDTGEDTGYTEYNAMDPLELWAWRPVRDYDGLTPGNFVDPYILEDKVTGPQIIEAMILASTNVSLIPTLAEGTLFLEMGTFATGGVPLSGAPPGWPMTMAEMASALTSTGEVDIILTPIADISGNMARIDVYNGHYGNNLTSSVVFQYGTGLHNIQQMRWTEDLSNVSNKIQYYYGPKETVRRYKSNTTIDDPCLNLQVGNTAVANLFFRRLLSQQAFGVRMEIQEFDIDNLTKEQEPLGTCASLDPAKILFRRLWYYESWIRSYPRNLVHITPTRGTHIGDFDIGDLVRVECSPEVRGGFNMAQRIFSYTCSWDQDGVLSLTDFQTSPDAEGVGS